jgi:hypothetical protein
MEGRGGDGDVRKRKRKRKRKLRARLAVRATDRCGRIGLVHALVRAVTCSLSSGVRACRYTLRGHMFFFSKFVSTRMLLLYFLKLARCFLIDHQLHALHLQVHVRIFIRRSPIHGNNKLLIRVCMHSMHYLHMPGFPCVRSVST